MAPKRKAVSIETTVWETPDELEEIGTNLLIAQKLVAGNNITTPHLSRISKASHEQLLKALQHVTIWRTRCSLNNQLPHSVDSTANLCELLILDATSNSKDGQNVVVGYSTQQLQLAYSSAITRAINGFADAAAATTFLKTRHPTNTHLPAPTLSVSKLCQSLGIPLWIIQVRHDASHNELPSITTLRLATKSMLHYIQGAYWDKIMKQRKDNYARAKRILTTYIHLAKGEESSITEMEYLNSPLHCAKEYRNVVPVNIAVQVIFDLILEHEDLVPSFPGTSPCTSFPHDFYKIHLCFHTLFITLQESCPGFSSFLLRKLITTCVHSTAPCVCIRNLIRYLLSHFWLSFFLPVLHSSNPNYRIIQSSTLTSTTVQSIKRKLFQDWTRDEILYMTTSAPSDVLIHIYPLNSLCDLCIRYDKNVLALYLEKVIENKNRRELYGLSREWLQYWKENKDYESYHDKAIQLAEKNASLLVLQENDMTQETTITSNDPMSLENMEAFLGGSNDTDDEKEEGDATKSCTDVLKSSDSSCNKQEKWVQCTSWETCPIGSLPSHC